MISKAVNWNLCEDCEGRGKKIRRLRKKVRLRFQRELDAFENENTDAPPPVRPKGHSYDCLNCGGSGLVEASNQPLADVDNYPHVAIIGGGISGVALAVACLHRSIPFTLYERDSGFDDRSQGYGLTLQQASKALKELGILTLHQGVISTRHVVHTTDGNVIGEWGVRKWLQSTEKKVPKRTNIHIARQALRMALLEQLGGHDTVQWGHKLVNFTQGNGETVKLDFQVDGAIKTTTADLVVGADGIRSSVRKLLIDDNITPLRYLGCIVILGICPLANLMDVEHSLLDSATVFQTANGNERMYMMPYTADAVMWQFSYPIPEDEAKVLCSLGVKALKNEALRRCQWHAPIPDILAATLDAEISGYPVYDRALLTPELLAAKPAMTLIGDAAHPMSPFKGQGANQALLDALALARGIATGCRPFSQWRESGLRDSVLTDFEAEMLARSASKVIGSAEAAEFLHSDVALHKGDEPRGRILKRKAT